MQIGKRLRPRRARVGRARSWTAIARFGVAASASFSSDSISKSKMLTVEALALTRPEHLLLQPRELGPHRGQLRLEEPHFIERLGPGSSLMYPA
jgi:hypothetical protein